MSGHAGRGSFIMAAIEENQEVLKTSGGNKRITAGAIFLKVVTLKRYFTWLNSGILWNGASDYSFKSGMTLSTKYI